jgi:protein TonB
MQTMRLVEGYNPPSRLRPGSLGLTLLTTGVFVSGLFFLNPKLARIIEPPLIVKTIKLDPPPPPDKPVEQKQVPQKTSPYVPPTHPDVIIPKAPEIDFTKTPPLDTGLNEGLGTGTVVPEVVKPVPVLIGANVDPRYANYLQPPYPAEESRAGNAGRVTLRVLVGIDGRVKDVEKVSAASDSFWDATRRQALSKWRFKPATRDGVPYEAWKTMNVSFVLNQDQ